jgi:hypothetical protein
VCVGYCALWEIHGVLNELIDCCAAWRGVLKVASGKCTSCICGVCTVVAFERAPAVHEGVSVRTIPPRKGTLLASQVFWP